MILFYGHDSPWWLLSGDFIYDSGFGMEAASPTYVPALLSIRDSVAVGLDQALWFDADVPRQGKNSLGTWFSKSLWNNYIGPEHWLPAVVLDISRGNAIANPWVDLNKDIQPHEYPILVHLTQMLKRSSDCFLNTEVFLGSQWKVEPYGYLGSNGRKAFLTTNNPTWLDQEITVELGPDLGLWAEDEWEIYLHFPVIGRAVAGEKRVWRSGERLSWYQSPFEVVLIEVTPIGEGSIMKGPWKDFYLPVEPWDSPARKLEIRPRSAPEEKHGKGQSISVDIPACADPGIFALVLRMTEDGIHRKANYTIDLSLKGTI